MPPLRDDDSIASCGSRSLIRQTEEMEFIANSRVCFDSFVMSRITVAERVEI
jgi:hypothetical protein